MVKVRRLAFGFILFLVSLFLSFGTASATVVINEIMPHPDNESDWIELYLTDPGEKELNGWKIEDSTGVIKTLNSDLKFSTGSPYLVITVSTRLNNGGDKLVLVDDQGKLTDEKSYDTDPGTGISLGRSPDGSDNWGVLLSASKGNPNAGYVEPTAVPSVTATPVPSSTLTPKPSVSPKPSSTPHPENTSTSAPPTITKFVSTLGPSKDLSVTAKLSTFSNDILGVSYISSAASVTERPKQERLPASKHPWKLVLLLSGAGVMFLLSGAVVYLKQKIK